MTILQPGYSYAAKVLYAHDGDTIKVCIDLGRKVRVKSVDLGFHIYVEDGHLRLHESIRLLGLNAPELATPDGKTALAYLQSWLKKNCDTSVHNGFGPIGPVSSESYDVTIATTPAGPTQEKYGRWLGTVIGRDGVTSLNQALLDSKHAAPWDGQGTKPLPTA